MLEKLERMVSRAVHESEKHKLGSEEKQNIEVILLSKELIQSLEWIA